MSNTVKILVVSNMYPSIEKAYSGIFVKNQYEKTKELLHRDKIDIFFLRRSYTSRIGSVFKYIKTGFKFIPHLFKRYDVVHLHFFFPLILLVWFYKICHPNTKLIVTFHGSDINLLVTDRNKKYFRFFAKKIDFTIPVGQQVSKNIKTKLHLKTGKILPVGINDAIFYHDPQLIKKYDLIFVGSFLKIKGVDILYDIVKQSNKSIRFCIVGKGLEYEKMFRDLQNQGYQNISLKIDQSQNQLRVLYNQSRFLILPSRSEGFPTVTLEAMYCGTPVLTSDIPQFKEQITAGYNGFMFPIKNISVIIELIEQKLKIPEVDYAKLKLAALESHKQYALTNVCHELIKIYKS